MRDLAAALISAALLLAACGDRGPSVTAVPIETPMPTPAEPLGDARPPGIANVQAAVELLPRNVGGDWQFMGTDPNPSPQQMGAWIRDMQIAVDFEAAVAVASYARENRANHALITVFSAPDRRIDPLQHNGPAFAERWISAYGCDGPRYIALAGVVVGVQEPMRTCLRRQYLLVFEGQLVVIEDEPDMTQRPLDASAFAPLVAAIMEQAE